MNVVLQIPTHWLMEVHPQYPLMSTTPSGISRMVVELLGACNDRYAGEQLENYSEHDTGSANASPTVRVMVYLPEKIARGIRRASVISNLTPGQTAKALLYRLYRDKPESPVVETNGNPLADVITSLINSGGKQEIRQEQITLFNCMIDALSFGRIGMIEGSTGVGKSMAQIMAAVVWVEKMQQRCVVTTTSLAVIRQFIGIYHQVASVREVPELRVIFGRQEFVSAHALASLLDEDPALNELYPRVKEWFANNGADDNSYEHYCESRWLVANLQMIAPDFPIHDILLSEVAAETDPGLLSYLAQFEMDSTNTCQIVLCTHAMLGSDLRFRMRAASRDESYRAIKEEISGIFESLRELSLTDKKDALHDEQMTTLDVCRRSLAQAFAEIDPSAGRLPPYRALVVDEAHQLESNLANMFSDTISLRKLHRSVQAFKQHGGNITTQSIDQLAHYVNVLAKPQKISRLTPLSSPELAYARSALHEIVSLLKPTSNTRITAKTPPERVRSLMEIRRCVGLIALALKNATTRSYLKSSNVRGYPQLFLGMGSIDNVLRLLWDCLDAAAIVSATLYLRRQDGPSANYMGGILQIDETRRADYPPVEAAWLHKCISKVFVPTGQEALQLRPPSLLDKLESTKMEERTEKWLDNLAIKLSEIHKTSSGGILVLNTSYDVVSGLTRRLMLDDQELICAQEGVSVQKQATQFLTSRNNGQKPLWLAVGAAWTGLDVGGHEPMTRLLGLDQIPAKDDHVLTDLVIPRLPFGTNMSLTHQRRIATKSTIPWDLLDAAFRFQQGLGRLVRRNGLPHNRRIWILDGRLDEPLAKQRLALFWNAIARLT